MISKVIQKVIRGKLTNGQLVKKKTSKKDCVNVKSALEADLKSIKGKNTKEK